MSDTIKRKISVEKFYKLDDAINSKINSNTVFILANERIAKDGNIGRYYVVFPSFKLFLKNREKYPNCHEIFVNHINNKIDQAGRLVFDFDIKYEQNIKIPKNFKQQIQDTIYNVVTNYYNHVNPEILEFVWSSSQNPKKLSKHLTVKNMYFDNWIIMSKIFYKLFCSEWDRKYLWISSSKLIDFQIVRNKASLRMVGSTKIDGTPLVFDDNIYSLSDSLIRIYLKNQRDKEQLITKKILIIYQMIFYKKKNVRQNQPLILI
nr:DNA primase small subunit [Mimivirus sp.]